MRNGLRMVMLNKHRRMGIEYEDYPESKFRDDRGREHYDNGRYAPMSRMIEPYSHHDEREHSGEPMSRGYHRYSDGRFAPRSRWDGHMPPVYYEEDDYMNPIGFRDDYVGDDLHGTSERMMGHAYGSGAGKMDRETAEEWMRHLKNADGTTGPHWTMEQCKQVMQQRGLNCDPVEFWVAMNAEYSDRCKVNEAHGIRNIDFYVDSAKAFWLDDKDAVSNKEAAYYAYVVKH